MNEPTSDAFRARPVPGARVESEVEPLRPDGESERPHAYPSDSSCQGSGCHPKSGTTGASPETGGSTSHARPVPAFTTRSCGYCGLVREDINATGFCQPCEQRMAARPVPGGEGEVDEREAFEVVIREKHGRGALIHGRHDGRWIYDESWIDNMWRGWQARAALRREASGAGVPVAWAVVDRNCRLIGPDREDDVRSFDMTRDGALLSAKCANECWMNEDTNEDREAWGARKPFTVVPLYAAPLVGEAERAFLEACKAYVVNARDSGQWGKEHDKKHTERFGALLAAYDAMNGGAA